MAKQTLETFTQKVIAKHGELYDFSNSSYEGLDKEITYICPIHGEVTQIAKKVLTHSGCPECDQEKAKKKRKGGKYAKTKGSNYELKIIHELEELGYKGLKSARSKVKILITLKLIQQKLLTNFLFMYKINVLKTLRITLKYKKNVL